MNNLYEKAVNQNDINMNCSLHNQSFQEDSLFAVSSGLGLKCEKQECDIKPDPYIQVKQELTPGLGFKSELPSSTLNLLSHHDTQYQDYKPIVSTQHQEYQADISMASSKKHNGL